MKRTLALIALALSGVVAFAQQPSGLTFSTYGGAMGICVSGSCNIGSVSVQSLSLTSTLNLEATQFIVPGVNVNAFYGGVRYAPSLDAWLVKNTLLPPKTFQVSFHAAPGVVANNSTTAGSPHFGGFAGGELDYAPMSDGKFVFGPRVDAILAPGIGTGRWGYAYSLSIGYLFGGTKANGMTTQVRRVWGTKN